MILKLTMMQAMMLFVVLMCVIPASHSFVLITHNSHHNYMRIADTHIHLRRDDDQSSRTFNRNTGSTDSNRDNNSKGTSIWIVRRKIARSLFKSMIPKPTTKETIDGVCNDNNNSNDTMKIVNTYLPAFFLFIIAAAFRYGGRAAIFQLFGFDFLLNESIKQQLTDFLTYFQSLGTYGYAAYLGAWMAAKLLCIDYLSILLAFSSGILFNSSLLQGTVAAVTCSTIASTIGFLLSRYYLRDKINSSEFMNKPMLRAINNNVSKNGFKSILALRLNPILPVPLGVYNYMYGTMNVNIIDFIGGISIGSIKPMLFDAYLGLFGKSIIDKDNSQSDVVLFAVIAAVFVAGILATQVVSTTIEEIKLETEKEESRNSSGTSSSSSSSTGSGDVASKVPAFLRTIGAGMRDGWDRVNVMLDDEYAAVKSEVGSGIDVDVSVDWNGSVAFNTADALYPGTRLIKSYEHRQSEAAEDMQAYTYESVAFSFALISKMFTM